MSDTGARFAINPPARDLARVNAVLHGRAARHHVESHVTTLSLKSVVRGAALYRAGRARFRVEPKTFLILNHGQRYALDFVCDGTTETLCVFFAPRFVERVAAELALRPSRRLDDPEPQPLSCVGFCERVQAQDDSMSLALARLHAGITARVDTPMWLEERFHELAAALARERAATTRQIDSFPGRRRSTREELFRRLHAARDYILASFAEPLSLERLAHVASISPFHLQRSFTAAFGASPTQLVRERRLSVAHHRIARGDDAVTQIALDVGFESLGSFSTLFRRRYGVSPRELRRSARGR